MVKKVKKKHISLHKLVYYWAVLSTDNDEVDFFWKFVLEHMKKAHFVGKVHIYPFLSNVEPVLKLLTPT